MIARLTLLAFMGWSFHAPASPAEGDLSAADYISMWKDEAVYQMAAHRIPASITLAQGMLESGNGNSRLAREGNNHFGIKCHGDWAGATIREDDETRGECFRKYSDARDSFDDHSVFLKRPRYASLFELEITDYRGWAHGLKACGYATNPRYPELLIRLIETHRLHEFDQEGLPFIREKDLPERRKSTSRARDASGPVARTGKKHPHRGHDPDHQPEIAIGASRTEYSTVNHVRYILAAQGESPESIAEEMGMGVWQIRRYNDLPPGEYRFHDGEIIYLQPKRAKGTEATYTVRVGDTLRSVSQAFAVRVTRICRLNALDPEEPLRPGTTLKLKK